jgi:hypothetical protein
MRLVWQGKAAWTTRNDATKASVEVADTKCSRTKSGRTREIACFLLATCWMKEMGQAVGGNEKSRDGNLLKHPDAGLDAVGTTYGVAVLLLQAVFL